MRLFGSHGIQGSRAIGPGKIPTELAQCHGTKPHLTLLQEPATTHLPGIPIPMEMRLAIHDLFFRDRFVQIQQNS